MASECTLKRFLRDILYTSTFCAIPLFTKVKNISKKNIMYIGILSVEKVILWKGDHLIIKHGNCHYLDGPNVIKMLIKRAFGRGEVAEFFIFDYISEGKMYI